MRKRRETGKKEKKTNEVEKQRVKSVRRVTSGHFQNLDLVHLENMVSAVSTQQWKLKRIQTFIHLLFFYAK